ncbi:MAG: hypothetical protein GEV08_02355 [Acidimicrobiia bacterium]|nr:hypothetical protein [Acidimicrobiia bacterium]
MEVLPAAGRLTASDTIEGGPPPDHDHDHEEQHEETSEQAPARRERARTAAALVGAVLLGALLAAVGITAWDRGETPALREPEDAPLLGSLPAAWGLRPYEGFGAWVDVFDFVPGHDGGSATPAIGPEHLEAMAGFGVRTLYLQAATGGSLDVVDPELVGRFLVTAHELDMSVVAWYLPFLSEPSSDLARLGAIADFEFRGHRFDGLAVDIEWATGVPDPVERSRRLVELSEDLEDVAAGGMIGAIVPPPAQLEDVNPAFWPGFPWAELGRHYDVFLPMAYWTERLAPWDDPYLLATHSMSRVRALVGDPELPVHVVGGVADAAPEGHYPSFLEAAEDEGAVGYSVYDYRSITVGGMARMSTTSTSPPTSAPVATTRS